MRVDHTACSPASEGSGLQTDTGPAWPDSGSVPDGDVISTSLNLFNKESIYLLVDLWIEMLDRIGGFHAQNESLIVEAPYRLFLCIE